MHLELSPEEATLLTEVLESELGEIREQIYKAEVAEYKATLRQREHIVTGLLERLRGSQVSSS